ncbi:MAG TPA: hypothetical protein VEJ47_22220 [Candidatus Eremiobacteraceae bacterium]|nr:hypothetical protein [Candidatus Eremiobacteraceae bacterium]
MRRMAGWIFLAALSAGWAMPALARGQQMSVQEYERKSAKAGKQQEKMLRKSAKQREKAQKKAEKEQRKQLKAGQKADAKANARLGKQ